MALGSVIIQETFEQSPRLTYRTRSRETFGSNLEVFSEEPELAADNGTAAHPGNGDDTRDRHSTTGSSPRDMSPLSPGENGECFTVRLGMGYGVASIRRAHLGVRNCQAGRPKNSSKPVTALASWST
jgi:hypothetical protein